MTRDTRKHRKPASKFARNSSLHLAAIAAILGAGLSSLAVAGAQKPSDGKAAPSAVPAPVPAKRPAAGDPKAAAALGLVITVAGDTGLNPNRQTVDPNGVSDGPFQTWAQTTDGIESAIDGDINFINVETVVTPRNDLPPDLKGQSAPFNFRMHPNGLKHLASKGFNVLSLANNHSMDYGPDGARDTLKSVAALDGKGVLAAAGIGHNFDEAASPHTFKLKGHTIAFAATGIITNDLPRHRAGPDTPGQTSYRNAEDYAEVRKRLKATKADLRLLSIHYGLEGHVRADQRQIADYRGLAAGQDNFDLIIGHHAHVVRGVELSGRSLIFYGLGNFLHHGTANMTGKGVCKDFGLLARIHMEPGSDGRLEIKAVEAIPVTNTHVRPTPIKGQAGQARVHALNYLGSTLDAPQQNAKGLRFTPQSDGTGLYCAPGAEKVPGRTGALCKGYKAPPPIPAELQGAISASCSS